MVPEGPLLPSLPLLFSVLFLVSSVDKSQAGYRSFMRHHVDQRRMIESHHAYCQHIMRAKGLTSPVCMKKNTFIHSLNIHVKVICGIGGIHFNTTLSDSLHSYIITTCHSQGGSPPNGCKYRGQSQRRRVRVACSRGVPVGFRGILIAWP